MSEMISATIIDRKRISQKLQDIFSYPLSIVHAPMGYGKTTAVYQFLKGKPEVSTIWVSLAASGGSVDYLWNRMTGEMVRENIRLGHQLKKLGFPYDALKIAKVLDVLIDYEYEKPTVVVLDDYQMINNPRVFALIKQIVSERIRNLYFVLITRDLSKIDAAGLYQKQLCFTLTEKSLKFSREEVRQYFALMDCALNESDLKKIYDYTDGWISMIYVIMKGMQRGVPIGHNNNIDDVIEQNLYNSLDESRKNVLLKLSFLDIFTIPMAIYILDDPDASQILQSIIKKNTFIIYNEFDNDYKIRNLLLEFLLEKARFENIDFKALHRRAGEWYLKEQQYMNAFEHLTQAGETEMILAELNKESTPDIHFQQFPQIHRIFDGLREEQCLKYPIAYLQYIRIYALSGVPGAIPYCRDNLTRMEEYVTHSGLDERYQSYLLGEIQVIWTFVLFNDLEAVLARNQKALEYFSGGCSCIVTRKKEFTFGSPHLLYLYYREKGAFQNTAALLVENCGAMVSSISGCGTGCDSVAQAEYALETGAFDRVELHAYKAIYKARAEGQVCLTICAKFTLARYLIMKGSYQEGMAMLDSLREEVLRENNLVLNTTFDLCYAYLVGCHQRRDLIPDWICRGDTASASFMYQAKSFYYIVYGKAVLLSGDYIQLEALCETFSSQFSVFQNQLGFLHNNIYEAVAKKNLHGVPAGVEALQKALETGEADNIVMPFVENAPYILDLLREIRKSRTGSTEYLDRMIGCCGSFLQTSESLNGVKTTLTNREKEILQLLDKGYKHEEIGGKLYISVTTVRYHIKNIYQKFEVNNKVLAIKKARSLNLI